MLNFKAIYEFLFKSFVVGRDVEMVQQLYESGHESLLIIKRSWLYGLASALWLIPLLALGIINVYLILEHFQFTYFGILLAFFVILNIIWTVYASIRYIFDFRDTYGEHLRSVHATDLLGKLSFADISFTRCFNQLLTNFLIFLIVIVTYFVHIFFIATSFEILFALLDVFCILLQLYFIRRFVHLIIDLEMDFNLVVKGRMIFVNQHGIFSNINTIESDKIKTIRSSYPSFLSSFFHFGTIEVLTEGDQDLLGHNIIEYVSRPEEAVEEINNLLAGKSDTALSDTAPKAETVRKNRFLENILKSFVGMSEEEQKLAIRNYLRDHEEAIKQEYEQSEDPATKEEIEELYKEYYPK